MQKTAYEMRISDWSSDVCSSDLQLLELGIGLAGKADDERAADGDLRTHRAPAFDALQGFVDGAGPLHQPENARAGVLERNVQIRQQFAIGHQRSEEHTSELQSLMRISYAVFCLKKKTTDKYKTTDIKQ